MLKKIIKELVSGKSESDQEEPNTAPQPTLQPVTAMNKSPGEGEEEEIGEVKAGFGGRCSMSNNLPGWESAEI